MSGAWGGVATPEREAPEPPSRGLDWIAVRAPVGLLFNSSHGVQLP